jgi:predicted metal-dependent phosphoesterase TrpH
MYLYDTHVHTKEVSRCGSSSAAEQVRAAKRRGYTGIIITDHLVKGYANCDERISWKQRVRFQMTGYEKAKKEGEKCGLDVFFGWEYASREKIPGMDILTCGLGEDFLVEHFNLFEYDLEKYSKQVRKHGGFLVHAHPFRHIPDIEDEYLQPHLFDGIEVFNSADTATINALAYEYALRNKLHMQAGSDSHGTDRPLFPCGVALAKKAENIFDIINAIKQGTAKLVTSGDI